MNGYYMVPIPSIPSIRYGGVEDEVYIDGPDDFVEKDRRKMLLYIIMFQLQKQPSYCMYVYVIIYFRYNCIHHQMTFLSLCEVNQALFALSLYMMIV